MAEVIDVIDWSIICISIQGDSNENVPVWKSMVSDATHVMSWYLDNLYIRSREINEKKKKHEQKIVQIKAAWCKWVAAIDWILENVKGRNQ